MGTSESLSAPSREPAVIAASVRSTMRFLPNMSASRETIGVATAPASRVAVSIHEPLAALVSRSRGRSGSRGRTRVWLSATTVPAIASTASVAAARQPVDLVM
jgi:hypothetical protein